MFLLLSFWLTFCTSFLLSFFLTSTAILFLAILCMFFAIFLSYFLLYYFGHSLVYVSYFFPDYVSGKVSANGFSLISCLLSYILVHVSYILFCVHSLQSFLLNFSLTLLSTFFNIFVGFPSCLLSLLLSYWFSCLFFLLFCLMLSCLCLLSMFVVYVFLFFSASFIGKVFCCLSFLFSSLLSWLLSYLLGYDSYILFCQLYSQGFLLS